jgi:hypothetical protein
MKTAVEWLMDNVYIDPSPELYAKFEQAKEMEKEQHANTWDDSRLLDMGDEYIGKQKSFNDYFNETYGGE